MSVVTTMRRMATEDEVHQGGVGCWMWTYGPDGTRYLLCRVHDRSRSDAEDPITVFQVPVTGPMAWSWDGNEETPTLTPSIRLFNPLPDGSTREIWHGFVTAGELREC